MFKPIRAERLLIRPARPDEAELLAARRSDPKVAEFQDWTVPYPLERAQDIVTGSADMGGPQNDEWWMAHVIDVETDTVIGDLAIRLTSQSRTAELGYTFGTEHWGHGFATEAVAAIVKYLFEKLEVTRITGVIHPDNAASARVLERTGFLFEGHTRSSTWVDGQVSDDHVYGILREDWEAWHGRNTAQPEQVRLVEITPENDRTLYYLRTHKTQEEFVAPMPASFANALFPEVVDGAPVVPWMRAIEADGELVGFVMLAVRTEHHPEPYLWRLLIDRLHQRRGVGTLAMDLVEAECRTMGDGTLLTSWTEGRGSPEPFYLARGFEPTGRIVDEEIEARKHLV